MATVSADGKFFMHFNGPNTLRRNQSLLSLNRRFRLTLQGDGNLVLYGPYGPLFSSGTAGTTADALTLTGSKELVLTGPNNFRKRLGSGGAERLILNNDGALVLHAGSFNKGIDVKPTPSVIANGKTFMEHDMEDGPNVLLVGQRLLSPDKKTALELQGDGNVVLTTAVGTTRKVLWGAGTETSDPKKRATALVFFPNKELVLVNPFHNFRRRLGDSGAEILEVLNGGGLVLRSGTNLRGISVEPSFPDTGGRPKPAANELIQGVNALASGKCLESTPGNNDGPKACLQPSDGNFVVYYKGVPLFASGVAAGAREVKVKDGALVVVDAGGAVLKTALKPESSGAKGFRVVMQDDGNLVLVTSFGVPVGGTFPSYRIKHLMDLTEAAWKDFVAAYAKDQLTKQAEVVQRIEQNAKTFGGRMDKFAGDAEKFIKDVLEERVRRLLHVRPDLFVNATKATKDKHFYIDVRDIAQRDLEYRQQRKKRTRKVFDKGFEIVGMGDMPTEDDNTCEAKANQPPNTVVPPEFPAHTRITANNDEYLACLGRETEIAKRMSLTDAAKIAERACADKRKCIDADPFSCRDRFTNVLGQGLPLGFTVDSLKQGDAGRPMIGCRLAIPRTDPDPAVVKAIVECHRGECLGNVPGKRARIVNTSEYNDMMASFCTKVGKAGDCPVDPIEGKPMESCPNAIRTGDAGAACRKWALEHASTVADRVFQAHCDLEENQDKPWCDCLAGEHAKSRFHDLHKFVAKQPLLPQQSKACWFHPCRGSLHALTTKEFATLDKSTCQVSCASIVNVENSTNVSFENFKQQVECVTNDTRTTPVDSDTRATGPTGSQQPGGASDSKDSSENDGNAGNESVAVSVRAKSMFDTLTPAEKAAVIGAGVVVVVALVGAFVYAVRK